VSSTISCVVIKSDRVSRKIPILGEVVRVAGQDKLFVVMSVDHDRHMAQLMERDGEHHLVDVPFSLLRTFNRNVVQAIHRFLGTIKDPDGIG
jgi:very-short-patch-repair endonuclease